MDNLYLIFVCLILGVLLQRVKSIPDNAYQALNAFVIYVSLPAVALYYIPRIDIQASLAFPLSVAWIAFLGAFVLFAGLGRFFGWSKKLIGCLILTAGLGNTSFVGFPVIQALYGEQGMEYAILVDQPGTFVVMSTLGVAVAAYYAKGEAKLTQIGKKVISFPPFIAFVVACVMHVFHVQFAESWQSVFHRIGVTVTPIALVSVGLQLRLERYSKHWKFLGLGLFYKLLLTPALIYVLYVVLAGEKSMAIQVSVLESAMAPMITAAILASSYGLKPKLSSMMIGFGIPLSFITLLVWYVVLKPLA